MSPSARVWLTPMVKRAPIDVLRVGTVQPGKYLILVGGSVAAVEEAHMEGLRLGDEALLDEIILPDVHEQVYESIDGKRRPNDGDALGRDRNVVHPDERPVPPTGPSRPRRW